jgi:hypothetical protein
VDPEHKGQQNASVAYIAACPTTTSNENYIKQQLQAFHEGRAPPDFATDAILNEKLFRGYSGHEGLSEEAKSALGYHL